MDQALDPTYRLRAASSQGRETCYDKCRQQNFTNLLHFQGFPSARLLLRRDPHRGAVQDPLFPHGFSVLSRRASREGKAFIHKSLRIG